jgi:deoxyribonuclease-4
METTLGYDQGNTSADGKARPSWRKPMQDRIIEEVQGDVQGRAATVETTMSILGAHQSIAGGYHKAVETGVETGCQVIQIFTKNTNQWHGTPIAPEEAQRFRAAVAASGVACPLAHDSYLINLASPENALWKKSIEAMIDEVQRAAALGIPWVVSHPGAYTTTSEQLGLERIITALDEVLTQTRDASAGILLETTAGQGTALGWRFEHLAAILAGVQDNRRLGVCFDTCHVFAAGYKISKQSDYRATMKQFDKIVGLAQIRAFHLNDSLKDCGSRVDRHARIGGGGIGPEAFGWLLRDRRFHKVPMVLETPKGKEGGEDLDVINLRVLRALAAEKSR